MLLTLGPLELATGQFDRPKSLLLLAFLALEGPQSRARLRTLFWPAGADPALQLRVTLNRLRTALPESLTMKGEVLSTPLPCDAKALLNAFEAGNDPEVVRLYRACFLDGLTLPNLGEELEEWMFTTRETLAARARTSILRLSVQQARETHFRVAADWAARAWALKEAPEPAASTLLDLHDLLLAGEHPDAPLVAHELTQLNLPITTSVQVARSRFARPPPKLPPLLRATVGRQSEVQEVLAWLTNPQERGVVINGPDGIGKTHLALEIAHTWPAPPGQAPLWLPLGSTPDPVVAGKTLLHLLNPDWQGHLNELQDMTATLNLHVTEPRLLVLDAAEALTAPQAFLTALLQVPNLRLLVTSSERLHLPRLPEYNLNGLKCHPEDTPTSQPSDAARLFLQNLNGPREQTELNTTAPVEGIVRLLRGYPLAILLASSWASTLSPA